MTAMSTEIKPLIELPLGATARITRILGGRDFSRRLLGLGLHIGSDIRVEHQRGRGRVVATGETRIALGGGIVEKVFVTPHVHAAPIATHFNTPQLLTELPLGACARLVAIHGGHEFNRRLLGLGLHIGSEMRIEHQRGRGRVIAVGETRIALGGGIIDKLLVTPLPTINTPAAETE